MRRPRFATGGAGLLAAFIGGVVLTKCFLGLFLDSQNRVGRRGGTLPRNARPERASIRARSSKRRSPEMLQPMIFAHNHPSGVAEPSRADELLTQALKQALALVDISTLDHFVVALGRLT